MPLLLASSSPRRAQLLREAHIPFDVVTPQVDEIVDPALPPEENARALAQLKGEAAARHHPNRLILTADTLVVLGDEIIGKPVNQNDAIAMLQRLANAEHRVLTGLQLRNDSAGGLWSHVETTVVRFHPVTRSAIEGYVATGEPMDKAGGYAFQGGARGWIKSFDGSQSNIIGLPLEPLLPQLAFFGITPLERMSCR